MKGEGSDAHEGPGSGRHAGEQGIAGTGSSYCMRCPHPKLPLPSQARPCEVPGNFRAGITHTAAEGMGGGQLTEFCGMYLARCTSPSWLILTLMLTLFSVPPKPPTSPLSSSYLRASIGTSSLGREA